MKRSERIAFLTKTLIDCPNRVFSLRVFSELTGASKTSLSEDIDILKRTFHKHQLGVIETIVGAGGGVRYKPKPSPSELESALRALLEEMQEPSRLILSDFIYYGDILFNPASLRDIALAMIVLFSEETIDGVLTIETKGVPLAMEVARLLGVRAIVARKTNRASEGVALSVHYKSFSHNTIQSMHLTKGAIEQDARILIIDDFMKAGGTIAGLKSLIAENEAHCVGSCVFMQELSRPVSFENHHYLFELRRKEQALKVALSPELSRLIEQNES
ncbi:MAG TPA: pur operon repressor [Tissierellia bacterium]|nr:pur operon repressor [Tissierellia bacterium]